MPFLTGVGIEGFLILFSDGFCKMALRSGVDSISLVLRRTAFILMALLNGVGRDRFMFLLSFGFDSISFFKGEGKARFVFLNKGFASIPLLKGVDNPFFVSGLTMVLSSTTDCSSPLLSSTCDLLSPSSKPVIEYSTSVSSRS